MALQGSSILTTSEERIVTVVVDERASSSMTTPSNVPLNTNSSSGNEKTLPMRSHINNKVNSSNNNKKKMRELSNIGVAQKTQHIWDGLPSKRRLMLEPREIVGGTTFQKMSTSLGAHCRQNEDHSNSENNTNHKSGDISFWCKFQQSITNQQLFVLVVTRWEDASSNIVVAVTTLTTSTCTPVVDRGSGIRFFAGKLGRAQ